jgi:hypothetical protein
MDKHKAFTIWPDLSKDQKAWELAKVAMGPDAHIGAIIDRAVQIKAVLQREQSA